MITPEWLTLRLRESGFRDHFRVRECRVIGRKSSGSATRFTLRIRYGDVKVARKLPEELVLKVYHQGHPQADKEVTFYRRVVPVLRDAYGDVDLSLTDVYDAHYDVEADQAHVLMTGIPNAFKRHREPFPPTRRHNTRLADALAQIHACLWEDERLGDTIGLSITEQRLEERLNQQREAYEQFVSDRLIGTDAKQRDMLNTVAGTMPTNIRERLLNGRDLTLIHSWLSPDNLLYSHGECRILDWKAWRPGLAVEDLAFLIAFHWPPAKRQFEEERLLKRYWSALNRLGVRNYYFEDWLRDYRVAIGLRLGELIGRWRREDWREGRWRLWSTILTGMQAFEDMRVAELFTSER